MNHLINLHQRLAAAPDGTVMRKVRDDIVSHGLAEGRASSIELAVDGKGVTDYRMTLAQMGVKPARPSMVTVLGA